MTSSMRVSRDLNDPSYRASDSIRRVWHKDQEVMNWQTADEFRCVVITVDGRVLNGSCRIERLPEDTPPPPEPVREEVMDGFVGAGLVYVPDKPVHKVQELPQPIGAEPVADPEPLQPELPVHVDEVRPEVPDVVVDEVHSEPLPDGASQE